MVELDPYPFGGLVSRMFRELEHARSIFGLSEDKFYRGDAARDLSVRFHGKRASTPLGPAAGPQSQLAQNIVLSWLGGSRIIELKTVQILDELEIPRPCIDMHNVGYNVEWSQELKLEQSLEEYVKAAMLVRILVESGRLELQPGSTDVIYDMSVGYDLAGIRSDRVQAFIRGMRDAGALVDRLRREIPDDYAHYRDLDFESELSSTLTLSTFHGCPPDEIEKIIDFLLEELGLSCVVKLNPTLLGPQEVRRLLHDELGYTELHVPDEAFAKDTTWPQAEAFVDRLRAKAARLGLGFGVKFSNTLIVENHRDFFPTDQREMYLSGPPLHVLAIQLVDRFRRRFGAEVPVSFSAGIDRRNFADAVALGLTPITVCSDLLKPGGYARQQGYLAELGKRMDAVGATDIDSFIRLAGSDGANAAPDRSAAELRNTQRYAADVVADPRYQQPANRATPKKIGRALELFDCLSCDKCIPVCPNHANFAFALPPGEIPVVQLSRTADGWEARSGEPLRWSERHQIGNFADFCNECGNCDVFCPEDGGPYVMKPRFFGTLNAFQQNAEYEGFHLQRQNGTDRVHARFAKGAFTLTVTAGQAHFTGDGLTSASTPPTPRTRSKARPAPKST